jgi:putative NADH-flavin reductase
MKLLVIGATGATGKILVDRALAARHDVTAFARNPEKLGTHPQLTLAKGDVLDPASLDRVVPGHDAVILCVGSGATSGGTLRTDAARNTVAAMSKAGVKRLIAMSGLGAGVTRKNMGFLYDKVIAPIRLGGVLKDQNGLEAEIRKSGLEWILVRPGQMTDVPPVRKWAVSFDGSGISTSVSREDVALFMLEQVQGNEYLRTAPALGY